MGGIGQMEAKEGGQEGRCEGKEAWCLGGERNVFALRWEWGRGKRSEIGGVLREIARMGRYAMRKDSTCIEE